MRKIDLIDGGTAENAFFKVSYEKRVLTVGNGLITRAMSLESGAPVTVSLRSASGTEYAAPDKLDTDFSFIGMLSARYTRHLLNSITAELSRNEAVVRLTISKPEQRTEFIREYRLYRGITGVSVVNFMRSEVMPDLLWSRRGDLAENIPWSWQRKDQIESCVDSLKLAAGLRPRHTVEFTGRTDFFEDLVRKHIITDEKRLDGNLLYCSGRDGDGVIFLQEAPPSAERRDFERYDFRLDGNTVFSCNWGVHPAEARPKKWFRSYRNTLLLFGNSSEEQRVLKEYQRIRFHENAEAERTVTVNPWGGGDFGKKLSEDFLLAELRASAEIGATHYQIDDGYQTGNTTCVSLGNLYYDRSFWEFSERLPHGFERLKQEADRLGIELSLWFLPGRNREFRDWRESAEVLLGFHRKYGIRRFKIDGVYTRTYESERNLERLLNTVWRHSDGNVFFDMDVTNGQRPGYWMFREYSNVFIENRYCRSGWGYHPEKALRTLWRLGRYLRLQFLQMEIPSVTDVRIELYEEKGLKDPRVYPPEYWAAVALFANPLFWMNPSEVPPDIISRYRNVIELHKKFRDRIWAGEIYPVGSEPDGKSITGFLSHEHSGGRGMLILYREAACESAEMVVALPFVNTVSAFRCLYSLASVSAVAGEFKVCIPQKCSFALFEYQ